MPSSVDERYLPNDIFVTHRDLFDTFDAHTGPVSYTHLTLPTICSV